MFAKKYSSVYALLIFLFFSFLKEGVAQVSADKKTIFEFLSQEDAAKMTLEADLTNLLANRQTEDYTPALLTVADGKSFQVKIKPKGKYRRKVAEIPPLKIKFAKKLLEAENLDSLNEIKLVMPVYDTNLGDELVVREYIAYRMYERLTNASARARLVKLTLRDAHVEKSRKVMMALLLEDNEETSSRLNGDEIEQYGMAPDSLIQNQLALVAMFEYMIGNTDWDVAMMRNVRLIRSRETGKVILVPYDFDFSGFVSAPYASPSSESGLQTVRDRFLTTNGIHRDALRRAAQILLSAKNDLYEICRSKHLSKASSSQLIEYLETFFQQIDANGDVPVRMKVPLPED